MLQLIKKRYIYAVTLMAFTAIVGCSRKKDKFINRNMHALSTKYNVLFNGYMALEKGKEELATTYQDNYWEILPVERMQEKDVVQLPGQQKNSNFGRAEEKAAKAIQKHSMEIGGREKNYQIDEAYQLLGMARYYEQRMIPALEAFNYVLKKYPKSSQIVQAKIWREKVNMRLDNNELALLNLKKIFKRNTIEQQEHADIRAMMAEAYINLKYYDSAATSLKMAADLTKINPEKGRYLFILGQLYNQLGKTAKANATFDKVIELNRRSPRAYMINAYIQKARNFDYKRGDKNALRGMLEKLAKNRENRPWLDLIYHEIGNYYLNTGDNQLAATYYNMSLAKRGKDKYMNALNYYRLGEMEFNQVAYKDAGKYYDSTLTNLNENTKMYRSVKKKRDNLEDVIYYEDLAQHNDSIISVVTMDSLGQVAYFEKVIEDVKAQRKAEEAERKKQELIAANKAGKGGKMSGGSSGSSFYFYNESTLAYGRNQFKKVWGDRKLEDDWRLSDKNTISDEELEEKQDSIAETGPDALVSVDYYMGTVPTDAHVIDSIYGVRNYAYYQLGLIYFAKFKEYNLAANRLEALLDNNPDEGLIVPAKYNLYKIYLEIDPTKAALIKQSIIANYPDSRYAMLLQNPYATVAEDENSPDAVMSFYVKSFEEQDYNLVLDEIDDDIARFTGEPVVPKLEMMKAATIGRVKGLDAYKEALNYVALNYPASDEGKQASNLLKTTIKLLEQQKFATDEKEGGESWKWVLPLTAENKPLADSFKEVITSKADSVAAYQKFKFSTDVYNENTYFMVMHGLTNKEEVLAFKKLLKEKEKVDIPADGFFITSGNYSILQIHKNLDSYIKPNLP